MQTYFKIMMLGEGMNFEVPEGVIKGFYATRVVRAKDADAASTKVRLSLYADLILQGYLTHGDEKNLTLTVESNDQVNFLWIFSRPKGFTFFLG